jgi:EAL domain-containing protein (putative c-di-GMP-specific phosphodiesterase class I)
VRTLAEIGVDYVQGWAVARAQAPERLLQAKSSADFIEDPQLAQLVACLGGGQEPLLTAVDHLH